MFFCSSVNGALYLPPLTVVRSSPWVVGRIPTWPGGGMSLSGLCSTVRLGVGTCRAQVIFFSWAGGYLTSSCYDIPLVLAFPNQFMFLFQLLQVFLLLPFAWFSGFIAVLNREEQEGKRRSEDHLDWIRSSPCPLLICFLDKYFLKNQL